MNELGDGADGGGAKEKKKRRERKRKQEKDKWRGFTGMCGEKKGRKK